MAEGQLTQPRADRGRGHHLMPDDVGGGARPQDGGVVDAVTAGQQRMHHREQLAAGTMTDADQLVGQRLNTQMLGQRRRQDQPRIGNHSLAVERDVDTVQTVRRSRHPEGASCFRGCLVW